MATLIEYLPLIVFFLVYKFADIFWATGVLVLLSLIQISHQYVTSKQVSTKNWLFFGLALVLGTLTILFQDEQFIKWKATIIYAVLAMSLLVARYFFHKNLVEKALLGILKNASEKQGEKEFKLEVPRPIYEQLNLIWAGLLAAIAALNIYIAYNFSLDVWVNFKVFGLMAITFVALLFTLFRVFKYLPDE